MKYLYRLICLAVLLGVAAPAMAQQPPQGTPVRVRGTVEKLDGQNLTVKTREGASIVIAMAPNAAVRSVLKRSLSDIKNNDFIASTSVRGTDGKLRALEVHIFTEQQRGVVPELQGPWDLVPDSVMTNAVITGAVTSTTGSTFKMKYRDQETEVIVPADIPIVTYGPGDLSLLRPGAAVFVMALRREDGTYTTASITAEKDGVKPPM